MGDIYHAGEVYAGSVPIDDTQASEDTVYSSAKVETMIEGVQERLTNTVKKIRKGNDSAVTIDANSAGSIVFTFNIPQGYESVGVLHMFTGQGGVTLRGFRLDNNVLTAYYQNETSSAKSWTAGNITAIIATVRTS